MARRITETLGLYLILLAAPTAHSQQAIPTAVPAPVHLATVPAETQTWLADLIRIDTTNLPGNELAAAGTPTSCTESELLAIDRVAPHQFPGAIVVPLLSTVTASAELRLHNVQARGLLPFSLTEADEQRVHGDDELLPLASFHTGVEFLYRIVYEFTAAK